MMEKSPLLTEETLEKQWEYFRSKGGYANAPEGMVKHLKRAFFAGIAQTVIMVLARSKTQDPETVFRSIQEQLEIYWQQDKDDVQRETEERRKKN